MHIHTIEPQDTIFKIARRYSVQPTKIMEDNGLYSDRLAIGEELLILNPTRTVTVRGGESLVTIGKRFGVKKSSLIANNPALCGGELLRPGHILSVKFDTPPMGVASAVGILAKQTSEKRLAMALPYLTYIIVKAFNITPGGIKEHFPSADLGKSLRERGKIPLLSFADKSDGAFLSADTKELCRQMVELAKGGGYSGIGLDFSKSKNCDIKLCENFLLTLKKHLYGNDLILFCDGGGGCGSLFFDVADGVIFRPEHRAEPSREECDEIESSKAFLYISTEADFGEKRGSISEAKRIARARGITIKKSGKPPLCHYDYIRYTNGCGRPCSVKYPSLESILGAYSKGAEEGFLGFAFDIGRVTAPILSLFNACFARADYSII